jgi:hypothetical protein
MKPYTYAYWTDELKASKKMLRRFHNQGAKIVERYVDYRSNQGEDGLGSGDGIMRLNLFNANVGTLIDMLYGQLPKAEVDRTFADSNDDVARVASTMLERVLNLDIAAHPQHYDSMLRCSLQDRLLPGLGVAKVRYEAEFEDVEIPAQMGVDPMGVPIELAPAFVDSQLVSEDSPTDYFHWQDVRWGWTRSFDDIPWIGFRSFMTKEQAEERFGAKLAKKLDYKKQKVSDADIGTDEDKESTIQKAAIWELWCKESGRVYWYSQGADVLLDKKDDPLQLTDFYPCPQFMVANTTTSLYVPTADYHLSQDLYTEIDLLQTRISMLTAAVKAVGVYDSEQDGVKRMLQEGTENTLIPVDSWSMFGEKGGLQGVIDWMPLADIVGALDKLIQVRDQTIGLLQQVSGMGDVMQGSVGNQYEGVGQTQLKAQFGSVKVQALSEQFADFAGQLMNLKAEVICRHYEPQTIVAESNMQFSFDAELIPQAVQLLKAPEQSKIRIMVRPETVAIQDFARLKSDRTEFLNGIATFMQSAAPMLEQQPDSLPYLLKMLQWSMSGFKGSGEIEGVLDKAIEGAIAAEKAKKENPQPDPAAQAEQAKIAAEQAKVQAQMQAIQAKAQADQQLRQLDAQMDMQTVQAANQAKMSEIQATHQARMAEIQLKHQSDLQKEQASVEGNLMQTEASVGSEMAKDEQQAMIDMEKALLDAELQFEEDMSKSSAKIEEISIQSEAKLAEMISNAMLAPQGDSDDG